MKRFILFVLPLLACFTQAMAAKYELRPVYDLSGHYEYGIALGKDFRVYLAVIDINGSDAVYTICDNGLETVKTFTVKNAYGSSGEVTPDAFENPGEDWASPFDTDDFFAVQGLLDDENKWVVAVRRTENSIDWYTEDGDYLLTAEDFSYQGYVGYCPVFVMGKWYVSETIFTGNYDTERVRLMSFRSNESGKTLEAVSDVLKSRVYPNPARSSEMVTVELAGPAEADTEIVIVNMTGSVVNRVKVPEGETSVAFNASRLSSGTYVFHVNADSHLVEQGKLIIR